MLRWMWVSGGAESLLSLLQALFLLSRTWHFESFDFFFFYPDQRSCWIRNSCSSFLLYMNAEMPTQKKGGGGGGGGLAATFSLHGQQQGSSCLRRCGCRVCWFEHTIKANPRWMSQQFFWWVLWREKRSSSSSDSSSSVCVCQLWLQMNLFIRKFPHTCWTRLKSPLLGFNSLS